MKVLVCGGRDYQEVGDVHRLLDALNTLCPIVLIIHGAARGADTIAANWAVSRGVASVACPAEWDKHGRSAGHKRNAYMLQAHRPDLVVAFPGGKGTADMIKLARGDGAARVIIASDLL